MNYSSHEILMTLFTAILAYVISLWRERALRAEAERERFFAIVERAAIFYLPDDIEAAHRMAADLREAANRSVAGC